MIQTMDPQRAVHFIGSIKVAGTPDAERAMRAALDSVRGIPLHSLTDGETGTREWWIRPDIERQMDNPNLEVVKPGDFSSYQAIPELGVRAGRVLTGDSLRLGYSTHVADGWRLLRKLRIEYHRPTLALQVGIPSPVDLAVFSMGFANGAHHIAAYADAVSAEIEKVVAQVGREAIIQIETPAALSLALIGDDNLPPKLQLAAIVAWVCRVVAAAPHGTRFGVHLCLGDMNNETYNDKPLTDGLAVSRLVLELLAAWPAPTLPEYLHFPVAGGKTPPLLDPTICRGLRGLSSVPWSTRIIAGVAHEAGMLHDPVASLHDQRLALSMVEYSIGRRVDVAAACGIARGRTAKAAQLVMRRTAELAYSPRRV